MSLSSNEHHVLIAGGQLWVRTDKDAVEELSACDALGLPSFIHAWMPCTMESNGLKKDQKGCQQHQRASCAPLEI